MFEITLNVADTTLLLAGIATLASAMIQGYSGFGGGLVIVPILAILFSPIEAIAITAAAGLAGNMMMIPNAARHANLREVTPLAGAVAITIPLGLMFLVSADPGLIRQGMGIFIIVAAFVLVSGWSYSGSRGALAGGLVGALTGGFTGGFGVPGGPFLVLYYMSSKDAPQVQRANIVLTIGIAIAFMLAGLIIDGAYTPETIARAVLLVPLFMIGSKLGKRLFDAAPTTWFKPVTYGLLLATGILALIA